MEHPENVVVIEATTNDIDESNATKSSKKAKKLILRPMYGVMLRALVFGKDGKSRVESTCREGVGRGSQYGTSTLGRHIKDYLGIKDKFHDVGSMMIHNEGKVRNRKMSQKVSHEKVAMTIIKNDLPFSFVEYERITHIFTYLNPGVKHISRNTGASDVWKICTNKKKSLRKG